MPDMDGFAFPVEVIRTNRRKTACVYLEGGLVKVRVPKSLSDGRIRHFIEKCTPWITTRLREFSQQPAPKRKEFVDGEVFPYLGTDYALRVVNGDTVSIRLETGCLVATVPETEENPREAVKIALERWYRWRAETHLRERTVEMAKSVGVSPGSVKVKQYKSCWGSCSARGAIAFDWRLILAPRHVVDYVVVHELCHLLEQNHSPRYWRHVEKHIPDWKSRKKELKAIPVLF